MDFIDTHCHIQSAGLSKGERSTRELWAKSELSADQLVVNAQTAGVTKLICVGCDLEDSQISVDFVQDRPQCWASIGIHPHEAGLFAGKTDKLKEFSKLAKRPKVVAIGECGLDYYYEHSPKLEQRDVLEYQLALAQENDLPVIFHVREAFDDFWPIFNNFSGIRGVLHSFTDNNLNLDRALKAGLYIGVNGIATFTKDPGQQDVYRSVPSERLLLETDAPFLTPTPYRGSINEPKYLRRVAEFLAEQRVEDLTTVARYSTANAERFFGI